MQLSSTSGCRPFNAGRALRITLLFSVMPLVSAFGASTSTIYAFTGGADGGNPLSGLTPDGLGNVYGTTKSGANLDCSVSVQGCGTVFSINAQGVLTTVHTFSGGTQGGAPAAGVSVIRGSIYGSAFTSLPGSNDVVFSMKPDGRDYTVLHALVYAEGIGIRGQLQPSLNGGEFGIARVGGAHSQGTLFYLGHDGAFVVVHDFVGRDGREPNELLEDGAGNLFGSTFDGGAGGHGVIFEYSQRSRQFSVLYTFTNEIDGNAPELGAIGPDGSLYGVSQSGQGQIHGSLFALKPDGDTWNFSVLTTIDSRRADDEPLNPPTLTSDGALVGQTSYGAIYQYLGEIYTISYGVITSTFQPFLSPKARPDVLFGVSDSGGGVPCSVPAASTCGLIFGVVQ